MRYSIIIAGGIVAAVWTLWISFNAAPPLRGATYPSDLIDYFYPLVTQLSARLRAGELPLWNPFDCSGIPLLATMQRSPFYPGTWLTLLLPPDRAIVTQIFAECLLGGWFGALFFRTLGAGVAAAVAGGSLFVFACLLGQSFWPPYVSTLLWLPWLLWCVEGFVRTGRWRWWAGLALGVALALLAGSPQYFVYLAYLVSAYALLRLVETAYGSDRAWTSAARSAGALLLAAGLGMGLAGAQLLPTLELVALSRRGGALSPDEIHYLDASTIPISEVLRNAVNPAPKLITLDYLDGGGYLGIATPILVVAALIAGWRQSQVWFLAITAGVLLLLSDGVHGVGGGLYRLYMLLPTGDMFRTPERLRLVAVFPVIVLMTRGFDLFARGFADVEGRLRRLALGGATLCGLAMAVVGPPAAGLRVVVTLALLGACLAFGSRPAVRGVLQAALTVFVVGDLALATAPHGSLRDFPKEWATAFHINGFGVLSHEEFRALQGEAGYSRIEVLGVRAATGVPPIDGAYRPSCYEPLAPHPWPTLHAKLGGTSPNRAMRWLSPKRLATFHDVASTRMVVSVAGTAFIWHLRFGAGKPPAPDSSGHFEIRRIANPDALPRAYLVQRFEVRSPDAALDRIVDGGVDFQRVVLLDRDPGGTPPAPSDARARPAQIVSHRPERVEIETEGPSGFLVLTDTFYPGWEARVDGVAAEIFRANGVYRAVRVPDGRHRVVFEYRPQSLRRGAVVSVASLTALLLSLFLANAIRRSAF